MRECVLGALGALARVEKKRPTPMFKKQLIVTLIAAGITCACAQEAAQPEPREWETALSQMADQAEAGGVSCQQPCDAGSPGATKAFVRAAALECYNRSSPKGSYRDDAQMMELSLRKGREMPREVRQNMSLQDEKEYYLVCIGDQKLRQSKRAVGGEFYAVFDAQTRELIRFFRTR